MPSLIVFISAVLCLSSSNVLFAWQLPKLPYVPGLGVPPTLRRDKSVEVELRKNLNDLRVSFYQIGKYASQQKAQEVLVIYRDILKENPANPKIHAEYVYAYVLGTRFNVLDDLTQQQKKVIYYYQRSPFTIETDQLLQQSIKKLPNSAEVYLILAAYRERQIDNKTGYFDYLGALAAARKAVNLDPKWGFAHYRLGMALRNINDLNGGRNNSQSITRNAEEAIREFVVAEHLESGENFRNINFGYIYAYYDLHRYDKLLIYVDKEVARAKAEGASQRVIDILQRMHSSSAVEARKAGQIP